MNTGISILLFSHTLHERLVWLNPQRALIYHKEGRKIEEMKALQEYIALYSHLYPLDTIEEVEEMVKKDTVDLKILEALLDRQITWYNDEVEQFQKTRTGFYGGWD